MLKQASLQITIWNNIDLTTGPPVGPGKGINCDLIIQHWTAAQSSLFDLLSASRQTCEPKEGHVNPWIYLSEMLIGCWTNFTSEDGAEVHILNLDFDVMVSMSRLYKWDAEQAMNMLMSMNWDHATC